MPLTPEDVQNKRFTVVRFKPGYDEEEVDNFLDEIETELRRLLGENGTLKQTAAAVAAAPPPAPVAPVAAAAPAPVPPPPAPVEEPNETALRTLLLAQRTADEAIAQAQSEAQGILTVARDRAASMESEAHAAHVSRVAVLEQERSALESEITTLRGFEKEFRTRLKAYLESQLGDLDARSSVAPPSPAGRPAPAANPPSPPAPTHAATPPAGPGTPAPPAAGVPGLAPPASPAAAPVPPVAPRAAAPATGPFSAAPTPGTPAFGARPAQPTPPPEPTPPPVSSAGPSAMPTSPVSAIDTDVDANSDAPSGPPAEASDNDTDVAGS
jgi:DivIVA domain-containing protein